MAILPPPIKTYHCICTSLLLASTHTLSSLPRRAAPSLDGAYILPIPSQPPSFSSLPSSRDASPQPYEPQSNPENDAQEDDAEMEEQPAAQEEVKNMPEAGYSLLLGMEKDSRVVIVRREDGFEKRVCWRCARCRVVVGYEITGSGFGKDDGDGGVGKNEGFEGKVVYLLPNGILGTDVMVGGKKLGEGDVEIGKGGRSVVWE